MPRLDPYRYYQEMDDPIERFDQLDALFAEALERPPAERADFLERACGGDMNLRGAVERLLQASELEDDSFAPGGALEGFPIQELADSLRGDDELVAGAKLGPYEIVDLLGEGGMGRVFRARDTRLDREVALKVLEKAAPGRAPVERFGREARAASALNHPNIVTIYDVGKTESVSFIAMEYVEGESLRARLARRSLTIAEALDLAEQVANGLAAAHAKGIVHRDLKPANIMITPEGVAKIVDFGLAKMERGASGTKPGLTRTEPLTAQGAVFGTVGYMSPEQATGRKLDHRSDLFSLGAVLYEMITGTRAFERESDVEVLAAILKESPTPIASINPSAPASIVHAIERCLQKDSAQRYASTIDLVRDLRIARDQRPRPGTTTILCPGCESENPREHRFCGRCGGGLWRSCPDCGDEIAIDQVFCGKCGRSDHERTDAVSATVDSRAGKASAMASERRQATVLVTRLSNYESLIEAALPDEVDRILRQFEESACRVVERFGGVIERIASDEVVALFGIPAAHEDDALRAVRSALELHRVLAQGEATAGRAILCSAVHTGPVVVQSAGGRTGERRVVGEAASIATGLARAATAGQILLSPESRRLAGGALRTESVDAIRLRGDGEPVVPSRVVAVVDSSSPSLEAPEAPLTVFAGRQGELGTLVGCVESAVEGEGQFVAIVGEAGAGKSRLFFELRRLLDRERIVLVEGRCQSHGERVPYLPLIHACRGILGVREEDPPERQLQAVVGRVREIDPELEGLLPLYLHLLSMPSEQYPLPEHLEGKPFRHAVQEALAALFTLASRSRPLILILEDWHWVDEASHEVVRQLAEMSPGYPLLVGVSYRPEALPEWGAAGHLHTIQLGALGPVSSAAIVRSVLGAEQVPDALIALIHERTGGNPFFLEEVCRTLREEGAVQVRHGEVTIEGSTAGLQLPESVQAVIRTRLDRIDPAARDLLRRASVVGREFSLDVLQRIVDETEGLGRLLESLKQRGLVRQARVFPEPVYRFQHALTQEVAYDSLLKRQKRELHGRVGDALEHVLGDRKDEYYDELARHFAEAENWEQAVHYGLMSAYRARRLSQFVESLTALDHTREWLRRLPESADTKERWITLLREESRVCEIVGDLQRQQRAIDKLLALLAPDDDRPELVFAHLGRAELLALTKQFDASEQALDEALRVSRSLGNSDLERDSLRSLAFVLWQRDRNEDALQALDRALVIDRERGHVPRIVGDLTNRASVLRRLGRYPEALETIEEALRIAPGHNPHRMVEAYYVAYTIYRDMGRSEEGERFLQEAIPIQKQDWFTIHQPFHISALANVLLERGEIEDALDLLRQTVEKSRQSRYAFGLSQAQQNLAQVLLGLGRDDEALPHLLESAETFGRLRDPLPETRMLAAAAPILERERRWSEAKRCWERVVEGTDDDEARLEALRGLARVFEAQNDRDQALEHLRQALALATRCESSKKGDVLNDAGILEWKRGRFQDALEYYRAAFEIYQATDDPVHAGLLLNSIGATLKSMERYDEAVETLERAVAVHERTGQELLRGHALALLGDILRERGVHDPALRHYRESLRLRQQVGDRRGEGWMRYRLAQTYQAAGDAERANENAALARVIASECDDRELLDHCANL